MIKNSVIKIINALGYDINAINKKIKDMPLYEQNYSNDSLKHKRFYNVGAGSFSHPYWTNIDFHSKWYKQNNAVIESGIIYDLLSLEPLPLETNTAEVFYTSHTIEHINDEAAQNLFNEAYRSLKPNGVFRITTPNIDLAYRAYKTNDRNYFYWTKWFSTKEGIKKNFISGPLDKSSMEQLFLHHFASNASTLHIDGVKNPINDEELRTIFDKLPYEEALNTCINRCSLDIQKKYSGNHINWWNRAKLERMLQKAGFKNIQLSAFGQSHTAVLRNTDLFDNTHSKISLYIDAKK